MVLFFLQAAVFKKQLPCNREIFPGTMVYKNQNFVLLFSQIFQEFVKFPGGFSIQTGGYFIHDYDGSLCTAEKQLHKQQLFSLPHRQRQAIFCDFSLVFRKIHKRSKVHILFLG